MAKAKTTKSKKTLFKWVKRGLAITKPNLLPATLTILLIIFILLTYQFIMANKFYPLTFLGDTNVSFLTKSQAKFALDNKFNQRKNQKLTYGDFTIDLSTASAQLNYEVLDQAYQIGRSGSIWERITDQFKALVLKANFKPKISLSLDKQLEPISTNLYKASKNAQLIFDEKTNLEGSPSASIQIIPAENGMELDKEALTSDLENYLLFGYSQSELPRKIVQPKVTTQQVELAKQALESLKDQSISLKFKGDIWLVDTKQLLTLLDLQSGSDLLLDKEKTYAFLEKIAAEIDQDVQEALFEFDPQTKRVSAFKPSQEGYKLDVDKTYQLLTEALTETHAKSINLPVEILKPKIETANVNSLGIKELIGRGISNFKGSIVNRIYNINLAASRINGLLIPPGEAFSFNGQVGDISAASGYKQAYVIKSGRTVLDDGGGVCQVSTTVFRAVLNSGLPVTQRVAHAYRVSYYEQGFPVGLDATIFSPSVDFKFKNDTPNHILIQAYIAGTTLYVDFYGTSDGRVATISKSIVTNLTSPPPELRQDDPTLPKGEVKQVDFPAWGANVSFSRTVTRGSETLISETFKSNYKAWQAVYLVGTKEN
ncbi:VanW family protein [Candidatus Daviesbacteria bacterium]|nr:VanW family protein [Candidatus Daviesbacteria bacterium]MBI4035335.1 VanW family protein [Candidatus Daviesbacteria bacterium]